MLVNKSNIRIAVIEDKHRAKGKHTGTNVLTLRKQVLHLHTERYLRLSLTELADCNNKI